MTDRKIKEKEEGKQIDNSQNKIITQFGPFENEISHGVLQSRVYPPKRVGEVLATRIKGDPAPETLILRPCQRENHTENPYPVWNISQCYSILLF